MTKKSVICHTQRKPILARKIHWQLPVILGGLFILIVFLIIANTAQLTNDISTSTSPSTYQDDAMETKSASDVEEKSQHSSATQVTTPPAIYHVYKVVDGDTVYVEKDGAQMKIRLIGVDTPETVSPSKPVQCYGPEASNFAKNTLSGKNVGLESDASQGDTDKYGRYLRYVYVDGYNFNLALLQQGFAREYTYNTAYKYQSEFRAAENTAHTNGTGLWNANTCNGGY